MLLFKFIYVLNNTFFFLGNIMKTFTIKERNIKRIWYYVDASNKILGRLATKIATILKGKHKPEYTPHMDVGDYIIVINSSKIIVTGKKETNKIYFHHTGYVGGLKKFNFKYMMLHHPNRILLKSVKGMLPKGPLGRLMFTKLKVFSGNEHNHVAQKPIFLNL